MHVPHWKIPPGGVLVCTVAEVPRPGVLEKTGCGALTGEDRITSDICDKGLSGRKVVLFLPTCISGAVEVSRTIVPFIQW